MMMTSAKKPYRRSIYISGVTMIGLLFVLLMSAYLSHHEQYCYDHSPQWGTNALLDACANASPDVQSANAVYWLKVSLVAAAGSAVSAAVMAALVMINRKRPTDFSWIIKFLLGLVPCLLAAALLLDKFMYQLPYHTWSTVENVINFVGFSIAIVILPGLTLMAVSAALTCMVAAYQTSAQRK